MPYIRGGAISYKVNLNKMSCGCVAGIYAVNSSQWCVEAEQANNYPMCASIDIMQANQGGFAVAGHPCANGTCDAVSRC